MSGWWHDLWNDPVSENPWALGAFVVGVGLVMTLVVLISAAEREVRQMFRRRKQETSMNDAADPQPLGGRWVESADDRQERERQKAEAEQVIAEARKDREPVPGSDELHTIRDARSDGSKTTVWASPPAAREMGEESRRLDTLMNTDPRLIADPLGAPIRPSVERLTDDQGRALRDIQEGERGEFVPAGPQPARNTLAGNPVVAAASVPAPLVRPTREACPHCEGAGYMPSISDHLRDSIAIVGGSGDEIVRSFYAELLSVAPDLASLFPRDLLDPNSPPSTEQEWRGASDEGKRQMLLRAGLAGANDPFPPDPPEGLTTGRQQRDKLLNALIALSDLYDPADAEKMGKLDTALKLFGRRHAAFARPDGTVRGATWEEYAAVKTVLFRTLAAAAGSLWRPEYTASWSQAYDYAAAVMLAEQYRSGFTAPRSPRS